MVPSHESRSPAFAPSLTAREMQVLASLMFGKTNREIAEDLSIAEATVKTKVSSSSSGSSANSTRLEAAIVGWEAFPMLRVLESHRRLRIVRDTA